MQRTAIPELLDSDSGSAAEIAASLADLRRINRWFGGVSTTQKLVEQIASQTQASSLSLLEVAAGAGYVPQAVCTSFAAHGLHLDLTFLDRAASHLGNGTRRVVGDALALPFPADSCDLVSSSLFAHHLPPDQLQLFVGEALRVCRIAVLINDLVRSPIHLALVYAGYPLYRSRITRHDAPASVRQAYTPEEIGGVMAKTPAAWVQIQRHYLYRMGVIAWKQWPPSSKR